MEILENGKQIKIKYVAHIWEDFRSVLRQTVQGHGSFVFYARSTQYGPRI